jgi:hypothetical protein
MPFAAINAALRCLPKELCTIISNYLEQVPHRFQSFETVTVGDVVRGGETISEIRSVDGWPFPWRLMVSSHSFTTGHSRLCVEFSLPETSWGGWIGVGVTTSTANSGNAGFQAFHTFSDLAQKENWFLVPFTQNTCEVLHADMPYDTRTALMPEVRNQQMVDFRLEMYGNPIVGSIKIDVFRTVNGKHQPHPKPITLLIASSTDFLFRAGLPDFSLLRPCIALAGQMTVEVRSGWRSLRRIES